MVDFVEMSLIASALRTASSSRDRTGLVHEPEGVFDVQMPIPPRAVAEGSVHPNNRFQLCELLGIWILNLLDLIDHNSPEDPRETKDIYTASCPALDIYPNHRRQRRPHGPSV